MTLFEQAATFLESEGWEIEEGAKGPFSMVGTIDRHGLTEYLTVWCPSTEDMKQLRQFEPKMLARFTDDSSNPGQKVLLLDSYAGLSNDFRQQTSTNGVTLRVPIQFFDHTFTWDDGATGRRRIASAVLEVKKAGADTATKRVPQPYLGDNGDHGDDLLGELAQRFEGSVEWSRPIILVTAPAGFGKTWLFQSLFARLHTHFHNAKQHQEKARRALPLLPGHLSDAGSSTLPGLIDAFLSTAVAGGMTRETFEWTLMNGYGALMLDGLDEVIARDPHFFEYIEDIVVGADKAITPRILICVRDSLLSTSESLRALVENDIDNWVTRFQLQSWQRTSVAGFAKLRLAKDDWRMLAWVDQKPQVLALCGTPYYCELIADRVRTTIGAGITEVPETELVKDAITSMLDREYDKKLFDENRFSKDFLYETVRDAAKLQLEGAARGIEVGKFTDVIDYWASELTPEEREAVVNRVLQLSLFTRTADSGRIRFTHDVIYEYLIAEHAQLWYGNDPSKLVDLLNWEPFPPDSIALRIVANFIDARGASDDLRPLLLRTRSSGYEVAFRNLLAIALRLRDAAHLLADARLEGQNLSGLTFSGLKLDGVSMRDANLESTTFDSCDLTGLDLSGAALRDTQFDRCQPTLHTATYGNLHGFVSVIVDGRRRIEARSEFAKLLRRTGQKAGASIDPCPHAVQLRAMFSTFLYADGRLRQRKAHRARLLRGSLSGAATVLNVAVRAGFIVPIPGRGGYECAKGPLFQAMAAFARNLELSPEVTSVLNGLCPTKNCGHVGL